MHLIKKKKEEESDSRFSAGCGCFRFPNPIYWGLFEPRGPSQPARVPRQLSAPALGLNGPKLRVEADAPLTTINVKGFHRLELWVGITKG